MKKKDYIFDDLLGSLNEAVSMESGKLKGRETKRTLSRPAPKWSKTQIKKLREEVFHMSQPLFASLLNACDCESLGTRPENSGWSGG